MKACICGGRRTLIEGRITPTLSEEIMPCYRCNQGQKPLVAISKKRRAKKRRKK